MKTAGEQIEWLNSISLEEQISMLMETVRYPAKACIQYNEMITLYRRQDLGKLLALTEEEEEMKNYTGILLDDRNKAWIDQILDMAREQSLLVAVGAAHLAGDTGVINLFKEKGYKISPVFSVNNSQDN